MLWSFEKGTILTPLSKNLALQKHMSITGLIRRLSLIGIDVIWQLSLGRLLMRTIASFSRYTGYLNFINGPYKSRFIASSSACTATELSFLFTSCLTAIKIMSLNIAQQFMKEMVKIYFGLLKIQVKFLIIEV